jgi:hypothetical protein
MITIGSPSVTALETRSTPLAPYLDSTTSFQDSTSALTPSKTMTLAELANFSNTGASPETLFGAVNGTINPSSWTTSSASQTKGTASTEDKTTSSLVPGMDNATLASITKTFNLGNKSSSVNDFLAKPLEQVTALMKGKTISEEEIFSPVNDGLARDAGLDPAMKVALAQEREANKSKNSQFGNTPYASVNLKKQAYLELARHDLQGALKLQEEAVKEEGTKTAVNAAALASIENKEAPAPKPSEPSKSKDDKNKGSKKGKKDGLSLLGGLFGRRKAG